MGKNVVDDEPSCGSRWKTYVNKFKIMLATYKVANGNQKNSVSSSSQKISIRHLREHACATPEWKTQDLKRLCSHR